MAVLPLREGTKFRDCTEKVAFHVVIYHEPVTSLKWEFGMPAWVWVLVPCCIVLANTHYPVGHERLPNCSVTL